MLVCARLFICFYRSHAQDAAVKALLGSMDKTATGKARCRGSFVHLRTFDPSVPRFSMKTLLTGWVKARPSDTKV